MPRSCWAIAHCEGEYIMKKFALISVAVLGLGLAACDGPKEEAMEDSAEAIRESADADAAAMEAAADATRAAGGSEAVADAKEDKADAVEAAGEEKADAMEDAADEVDGNVPG